MQKPISLLYTLIWNRVSEINIQLPPCLLALDCPADWKEFEDSCYKVVNKFSYSRKFVWSTASRVCPGFGGDLVNRMKEKWGLFITCLLRSEALPFGLDWLIVFRKVNIYGAMEDLLTVLFPASGWAKYHVMLEKTNAPKYWEMVGILPTVAKRINTSFVRGPKVSCASIESNDRSARPNLYLWVKFICRFFIT